MRRATLPLILVALGALGLVGLFACNESVEGWLGKECTRQGSERGQVTDPARTPSSTSTVPNSAAVGPPGRSCPWKCRHSPAIEVHGCASVSSTTTRPRACRVSSATNGSTSGTL